VIDIKTLLKLYQGEILNIIHIDMDAFYASVEERDNPKLKGHPVIVGGSKNYGIVTTANYEARKFGIHSAMPIFMAKSKCPHGIFIPTHMKKYQKASKEVFNILYKFTKLVEPVSIDEAYLDISDIAMTPIEIAEKIKKDVFASTGLTLSIGISYNKFLAKIASDWNKPNGIKIINRDMIPDILMPLSISKVHGIGRKTARRLNNIGIYKVKDLYRLSEDFLVELFGKSGNEIYNRIRGIDNRELNLQRERKSLGVESTFSDHTKDSSILKLYLKNFSKEIAKDLEKEKLQGRTITLKIKYVDFKSHTKSRTYPEDIYRFEDIYRMSKILLDEINLKREIRLIGLTISKLSSLYMKQISFYD
jgi:DNA polymerase IV